MKRAADHRVGRRQRRYSASLGGGLIEARRPCILLEIGAAYSASLGGGLIEARGAASGVSGQVGIPPLWEAASLKRRRGRRARRGRRRIPPLWEAASLKRNGARGHLLDFRGIPPLWEAASLKPPPPLPTRTLNGSYSASLGGGLIEARRRGGGLRPRPRYSASLGGGLIEAILSPAHACVSGEVFRLFGRRPH